MEPLVLGIENRDPVPNTKHQEIEHKEHVPAINIHHSPIKGHRGPIDLHQKQTNKSSKRKQQTIKHQPSTTSIHRDHHHRTESVHHSNSSGISNNEIDFKRPSHRMSNPLFSAVYHQQNSLDSMCSTA